MPGTIGYSTIGGSTGTTNSSWKCEASIGASYRYVASTGEAVTEVALYSGGVAGSPTADVGVYEFNTGTSHPATLVGSATITIGVSAGWNTAAVNISLTAGITYVVGISWWHGTAYSMRYDSPGGTIAMGSLSTGTLPDPWDDFSTSWGDISSAYATVSAGGDSGAPVLDPFTSSAAGTVVNPNVVQYVKEVGAVTNTTAGTTSAITVAAGGVPTGDVVLVLGSCDNSASGGAATTITVTDTRSNTWATLSPQALADPGAAAAGIQGFIAWTKVATPMQAGDTITITYDNSTTAKAINAQQFTNCATSPILSGSYTTQNNQTGTSCSVAANPTRSGQAVIGVVAVEGGTADSFTQDSDTADGSWGGFTRRGSGTTTSGATLNTAYKIVTGTSTQTYDPTLGTARDHACAIVVLDQPPDPITGTVAVTLEAFTPSAAGTFSGTPDPITGTVAVTLEAFTPSAAGTFSGAPGSGSPTLDPFTASASGKVGQTGTAAVTLAVFVPAASGKVGVTGTAAVTLGAFVAAQAAGAPAPTTKSGRKLLDQYGNPIQLRTLSSWGLVQRLSNADMLDALDRAQARGFNSLNIAVDGALHDTGFSQYSNTVTGNAFYTGTPYASSLGAAWANHVANLMDGLDARGMFLVASFFVGVSTLGNAADIAARNTTDMRTAGQNWATFLASWQNWALHVELDRSETTYNTKIDAFVQGILDIRPGVILLGEPNRGDTSSSTWSALTYFQPIESVYSYEPEQVADFEAVYAGDPDTGPVWHCEPVYIGNRYYTLGTFTSGAPNATDRQNMRENAYLPVEGCVGNNLGHEDWWPAGASNGLTAGDTFATALDNTVAVQWSYAFQIWDVVNETGWAPGSWVTTGEGSGDTKAAIGAGTAALVAYFPSNRTVVADTTAFPGTGNVRLRWFDPTAGTYATIASSEAQNASRSVTYPSNHADGTADFVLVVDDAVITGTTAVTLAAFAPSASGKVGQAGTAAVTLGAFASAASGKVGQTGAAAPVLASFTSTASGTSNAPSITGTAASTLAAFTAAASGTVVAYKGSATPTLGAFTATAAGTFAPSGSGFGSPTLAAFTSSASGTATPPAVTGTAAVTLAVFAAAASGTATAPGFAGTVAITLGTFVPAASGTVTPPGVSGTAAPAFGSFTAIGSGTYTPQAITGTVAIVLDIFVATAIEVLLARAQSTVASATATSAAVGADATSTLIMEP